MARLHVEMMERRTVEPRLRSVAEITRRSQKGARRLTDSVDILIRDMKREDWATGGRVCSTVK